MINLKPLKTHRYNVDQRFFAFHTPSVVVHGTTVCFEGISYRVKEIIKDQESRYHKKNNYYEIRV